MNKICRNTIHCICQRNDHKKELMLTLW